MVVIFGTLLLTFFYRHMKPMIDNGRLYIAQPPLYRIKKGNSTVYKKDESDLEEYLIEDTIKNLIFLKPKKSNEFDQIGGKELKEIIKLSRKVKELINPLLNRIDNCDLIEHAAIVKGLNINNLKNEEIGKEISRLLELRLNAISELGEKNWKINYNDYSIKAQRTIRGFTEKYTIDENFVVAPEAKELDKLRDSLMDNFYILDKIKAKAGVIKYKNDDYEISGPIDLINTVFEIGKSGVQINRYKGLGEMNPDQLWETTLDKNERVLLTVKINEVDEANKIFDDLMGELTEGRKKFIAENSLKVSNLDI